MVGPQETVFGKCMNALFQLPENFKSLDSMTFFVCLFLNFIFFIFFKFYFVFKLYIIVLVLPNIRMNPPMTF